MYTDSKKTAHIEQEIVFEERKDLKKISPTKRKSAAKRGYKELVLNLFEKSPEIGRLLVRLHDRSRLYEMAKEPDELARTELTQTVVDLLNFDLSHSESELIADVLMSLMAQAERDLRRSFAERLSVMQGVPLRLVLKMASDEIFVADSVLRKSKDLKDFDLIYLLKAQGKEHWQSMAQRPDMSEKVVDMLVDTGDFGTTFNVLNNKSVHLSQKSVHKVFEMAKKSEKLVKPLLKREELPEVLVSTLYNFVGIELKKYIENNFSNVENAIEVLDDVIDEFVQESRNEYFPTKDVIADAELMLEKGFLTPSSMIEHLRCGQIANFTAQLSVYCALPIETVQEMICQKTSQTMAIACKASLISKADFINMFLLTSRVRGARIINEKDLSRAISYYDKVSEGMAKALMQKYRH